MNLLLASSEVYPFSKTGGLADMVGSLAKFLARAGHRVGLVTPLYRGVFERLTRKEKWPERIEVPLGRDRMNAQVWCEDTSPNLAIYFIDQPELFDRGGIYVENGVSYPDNARRFLFFTKCLVELARRLPWRPEIVHAHDWQTAFAPLFIRHSQRRDGWTQPPRVCLTIHNLAYQGVFPRADFELTNLPWDYFRPDGVEYYDQMNCLKAGIVFADAITTVSPRYAREITTLDFGCGLDGVLRTRLNALTGILNGVDYDEWDAQRDPHLQHRFSSTDLEGKSAQKLALQRELGLQEDSRVPLFASITRLADQKGVELTLGALEEMLSAPMQFVLLGSGDPKLEHACRDLASRHPGRVAARIGFDEPLSHRIEAGADFFIMPSLFEPCGLNQMYSQRYGTIPIVRATGGLDDTVIDLTEDSVRATGIKFQEASSRALAKAIRKALVLYEEKALLGQMRQNAMAANFSWIQTAERYAEVYRRTDSSK